MDSQRAVRIGVIVADELLPVRTATIHMRISGYENVITLARCIDDRETVLVVVAERIINTLVDAGRGAANHTYYIQIPSIRVACAQHKCAQCCYNRLFHNTHDLELVSKTCANLRAIILGIEVEHTRRFAQST